MQRTADFIKSRGEQKNIKEGADVAASEETARRTLEDRVKSFNPEQRHVYREFEDDLKKGLPSKRVVLIEPGGTGKSYLIDTMTLKINRSLGLDNVLEGETSGGSRHTLLVKTAFTGVAASNTGGFTLHSALECAGRSMMSEMSEATLLRLQRDWESVKVLVIDEISFVSAASFNTISQRLGELFPSRSHLPFGGLHVLLCGDPFQLSPAGARPLWLQKKSPSIPIRERMGIDLYIECDAYFELSVGQRNHGPFYDALSEIQVGEPSAEGLRYLNSRHDPALKLNPDCRWTDSTVIVGMNKEVQAYNDAAFKRDCLTPDDRGQLKKTARAWKQIAVGRDKEGDPVRTQQEKQSIIRRCLSRRRSTRGIDQFVPNSLSLYVGQRVMLTYNMFVELGLFNGATGVVYRIFGGKDVDPHESKEEACNRMASSVEQDNPPYDLPVVLVQLDSSGYREPSLSKVTPGVIAISAVRKGIQIPVPATVYQLPLVQANAVNVHKTQALTIDKIVIDASKFFAPASWYVALSRVRSRDDVTLVHPISLEDFSSRGQVKAIADISDHVEYFRMRFSALFRPPNEEDSGDVSTPIDPYE